MPSAAPEARLTAEQVDIVRRRVLNVVGHELRTPVTTVRGLVEALARADSDGVRDAILVSLTDAARRLERLLDDLLVASGVTTALPVGTPQPFDVVDAVQAAWATLGRDDVPEVRSAAGARVSAPPGSLVRVLTHLLANAAAYGQPPVLVGVEPVPEGRVRILVESGGDAVPDTDLALAFEPFFRGERAVTRVPGLGLGLPVARALAEQAGGSVALEARPEGGVRAVLDLPAP